jgi:two-component system, LytTR family, sensor kinase
MKPRWPYFLLFFALFYAWSNICWAPPVSWLYRQYGWWWNVRDVLLWLAATALPYAILIKHYRQRPITAILLAAGVFALTQVVRRHFVYGDNFQWVYYYLKNRHQLLAMPLFTAVYFFVQYAQQQAVESREAAARLLQAELDLLHLQYHPHFLFNSLNNIYALAEERSPQALPAVRSLHTMLHFLYGARHSFISLDDELDCIREYLQLQQLRYAQPLPLQLDLPPTVARIAPLLLLPFVENIFKHGDVTAAPVQLQLFADRQYVRFYCRNAVTRNTPSTKGGIGLKNVQRRLQLLYPQQHQLSINNEPDFFTVQLDIRYA